MKSMYRFKANQSGSTAIEYALITALISIAAIVVMGDVGTQLQSTFGAVRDALSQGIANAR